MCGVINKDAFGKNALSPTRNAAIMPLTRAVNDVKNVTAKPKDGAAYDGSSDEAVLSLKRQTDSIRAAIQALQAANLDSKVQAAESDRDALDQSLRLTSGQGLRRQDESTTLLARPTLRPVSRSSAARASNATPYSATTSAVQAPITAATVLASRSTGGYQRTVTTQQER